MLPITAKTPSQEEEGEGEDNEMDDEEQEEEEEEEEEENEVRRKQKITIKVVSRRASSSSSSSSSSFSSCCCQADECGADLRPARRYNRRHKVCDRHAKAPVVLVSGTRQRFCQQCSKFHELALFDDTKRSCRERLASHNERRRKAHAEPHAAGMEWTAASSHPTGPSQESD